MSATLDPISSIIDRRCRAHSKPSTMSCAVSSIVSCRHILLSEEFILRENSRIKTLAGLLYLPALTGSGSHFVIPFQHHDPATAAFPTCRPMWWRRPLGLMGLRASASSNERANWPRALQSRSQKGLNRDALMTMIAYALFQHQRLQTEEWKTEATGVQGTTCVSPACHPSSRHQRARHTKDANAMSPLPR